MNVDSFLAHYQIHENPFLAEEARHDRVFDRLADSNPTHPDFSKILGQIDRPTVSVVFGEKGSGKTAIRLLLAKQTAAHNKNNPRQCILLVPYDDLNPMLDNIARRAGNDPGTALQGLRLEDHQDAILSQATTRLVHALLGEANELNEPVLLPHKPDKRIKSMPRQDRIDLAVLAALYDQPRSGSVRHRSRRLRAKLRLGRSALMRTARFAATLLTAVAAAMAITWGLITVDQMPWWLVPLLGVTVAATVLLWCYWGWRHLNLWFFCRKVRDEIRAIDRDASDLRHLLAEIGPRALARQPIPQRNGTAPSDYRYQLTRRLVQLLRHLDYTGLLVLVDRVDEPQLVSGDATRMRAVIWPMFDNKFLQQEGIGLKLLLPIELRHQLHRESPQFFQEARLDKQNLIDPLIWSGTTLYDLCTHRMRACRSTNADPITLTDLFDSDVTRETVIDALDQMQQPRDAFKFLYSVIQEHCRLTPEDTPKYKIARLICDTVRRKHVERLHAMYRGLTPA